METGALTRSAWRRLCIGGPSPPRRRCPSSTLKFGGRRAWLRPAVAPCVSPLSCAEGGGGQLGSLPMHGLPSIRKRRGRRAAMGGGDGRRGGRPDRPLACPLMSPWPACGGDRVHAVPPPGRHVTRSRKPARGRRWLANVCRQALPAAVSGTAGRPLRGALAPRRAASTRRPPPANIGNRLLSNRGQGFNLPRPGGCAAAVCVTMQEEAVVVGGVAATCRGAGWGLLTRARTLPSGTC